MRASIASSGADSVHGTTSAHSKATAKSRHSHSHITSASAHSQQLPDEVMRCYRQLAQWGRQLAQDSQKTKTAGRQPAAGGDGHQITSDVSSLSEIAKACNSHRGVGR